MCPPKKRNAEKENEGLASSNSQGANHDFEDLILDENLNNLDESNGTSRDYYCKRAILFLCTGDPYYVLYSLYGAVDFLNVLKKGCWGGGGVCYCLLVHSEIFYVPVDDGWEEVLVRNVLHYVPISG